MCVIEVSEEHKKKHREVEKDQNAASSSAATINQDKDCFRHGSQRTASTAANAFFSPTLANRARRLVGVAAPTLDSHASLVRNK